MSLIKTESGIFWIHYSINNNPAIKKLQSFCDFDNGWHYGEGNKFGKRTIDNARDLITYLYNHLFLDLNVFPGLDGEIMIKAYFPKTAIEINLQKSLEVDFMIEDREGNQLFQSDVMSIEDFKKQILSQKQAYLNEWNALESYQFITTTPKTKGSQASPSKIHLKTSVEAFPLYALIAPSSDPGVFVSTLGANTQNTPILQFSGNLTGKSYQPELNLT